MLGCSWVEAGVNGLAGGTYSVKASDDAAVVLGVFSGRAMWGSSLSPHQRCMHACMHAHTASAPLAQHLRAVCAIRIFISSLDNSQNSFRQVTVLGLRLGREASRQRN